MKRTTNLESKQWLKKGWEYLCSVYYETKENSPANKTFLQKNVPCIQQVRTVLACSQ